MKFGIVKKQKVFKSFLWDFLAKFSNQIISFIVSIFLTRILQPEEFGIMGIALMVISLSTIFVDLGFGKAIIQRSEISETQLSTIFFINFFFSILLFLICYFIAQPLSLFFREPEVSPVLKWISVTFILYGLNIVQNSLLYRKLKFKVISLISMVAALLSGVIGVVMAIKGYGVWSLVIQNISAVFLTFIFTFLYVRWLPKLIIVFSEVKQMWQYSSRLFASSILDTIASRLDILLIGRMFSSTTLGYYTRAQSMDFVVKQMSSASLVSVLFPYLSREQHDRDKVGHLYRQYLHIISFASLFISGFFYVTATEIFTILFTSRWLESANLFKILALASFVYPLSALMVSLLSARGNSSDYFRVEVLKKLVLIPAYSIGFFSGLYTFLYLLSSAYIISLLLNMLFVKKEIGITVYNQVKIIAPYFIITVSTVGIVYVISQYLHFENNWLELFIHALTFFALFLLFNILNRSKGLTLIHQKIQTLLFK